MSELKYNEEHEWIRVEGDIGTVGISDYAQEQLGNIVFVDLPEIGKSFEQFAEAAVIESVKAASEIYAPVGGEIVEINTRLADAPGLVNEAAMGDGWFFKLKIAEPGELGKLMDEAAYKTFVAGLD